MNANLRNFALWVIIVLLLLALFTLFQNPGQRASSQDISFSQLLSEVDQNHVRDVVIQGQEIHGTFTNGGSFQTYAPNDPTLVKRLYDGKVSITRLFPLPSGPSFQGAVPGRLHVDDRGRGGVRRLGQHGRWPQQRLHRVQAQADRRQHHLHRRSHR
jgi:hypothetical protein